MKVFITWSGDISKAIAEILRGWLPSMIQAVKPYYSPDDITKGSRWSTEIAKELEECKVGLLCLTADNLEAPWIMFEAGALSKSLSAARVCPLLFGIEPSDIKGPLVQFQAAPFAKDEMKKAVRMINQELGPDALTVDVLDSVFEKWWPELEDDIKKVMDSTSAKTKKAVRSERDILEEILARVRASPQVNIQDDIQRAAIQDLGERFLFLCSTVNHLSLDARFELDEIVDKLSRPIEYIVRRSGLDKELPLKIIERIQGRRRSIVEHNEPTPAPVAIPPTEPPNKTSHRAR